MNDTKKEKWNRWAWAKRQELKHGPGAGHGEKEVKALMEQLNLRPEWQHPVGPKNSPRVSYWVDLALPMIGLAVELDSPDKDLGTVEEMDRTQYLQRRGWTIIRLDSHRAMEDQQYVASKLLAAIKSLPLCRCGCKQIVRQHSDKTKTLYIKGHKGLSSLRLRQDAKLSAQMQVSTTDSKPSKGSSRNEAWCPCGCGGRPTKDATWCAGHYNSTAGRTARARRREISK